jgi:hypothetical protein
MEIGIAAPTGDELNSYDAAMTHLDEIVLREIQWQMLSRDRPDAGTHHPVSLRRHG